MLLLCSQQIIRILTTKKPMRKTGMQIKAQIQVLIFEISLKYHIYFQMLKTVTSPFIMVSRKYKQQFFLNALTSFIVKEMLFNILKYVLPYLNYDFFCYKQKVYFYLL